MLANLAEPYWFHLHTTYTDGVLSVEDYFKAAHQYGINTLIFCEYIRRNPDYDVHALVQEVKQCAEDYRMRAHVGFEAKILEDGELDISPEHMELAEVIGIAEHGFPPNFTLFMSAWEEVMLSMKEVAKKKDVVWVHPGLFFRKNRLMMTHQEEFHQMLKKAIDCGILLEYNLRYNLIEKPLHLEYPHILGLDAHSEEDIVRWEHFNAQEVISSA